MNPSTQWVQSDRSAILESIRQHGLEAAAAAQVGIAQEMVDAGDRRWAGVTDAEMIEALRQLWAEQPCCAGCPRMRLPDLK